MIEIVDYAERWPSEFAALATPLRRQLGSLALRIDHIGSTSVPGLAAKDVIDIQLTVAALEPFAEMQHAIEALGYVYRPDVTCDHHPPGMPGANADWSKRYFNSPPGQRRVHLHVRAANRANQRYALLFRDYLRASPKAAEAYATLKRQLAHYHADDIFAYVAIKDPVCDIIMAAAEIWATVEGWQPGPSDA